MGILYKGLAFNNQIDVSIMDTTDIVNEAINIHLLSPVAAAALGRTMTIAAFQAACMKNENDTATITLDGDGVGGRVVVCANAHMQIRGLVENPQADLPLKANGKLDVGGFVGRGRLSVVRTLDGMKPYTSSCRIVSGEIGEDFAAYYTYSEQIPTGISVGVLIGKDCKCLSAGAIIMQALPDASEAALATAEAVLSEFSSVSQRLLDEGVENIRNSYFIDVDFKRFEPKYSCTCSRDYIDKVLISLGQQELIKTIEDEGRVEVACQFCPKKYVYNLEDVKKLFNE